MKSVEISLKEILVYVLRRWKPIVGFALVLAVLLGGYSYLQQKPTISENGETPAAVQRAKLSFSIDLINFDDTGMNQYTKTIAVNDRLSQLRDRYLTIAQGLPLTSLLEEMVPYDYGEAELAQLVQVESTKIGIIDIVVNGWSGIDAKEVAAAVLGYMSDYLESLSQSVSEHKLSILASSSAAVTPGLMPEPAPAVGAADHFSSALIGYLIGLVVGILGAVCIYLITLPVQIPNQIQRKLDVRYLGGVRRKIRLSLGDRLAGSLRLAKEEKAIDIISGNLRAFVGGHKRILVTGTVPEELITAFAEKMAEAFKAEELNFIHGADINKNADTIAKLADSDSVVLVERLDKSRLKQVSDEKERLDMSGKEILGYVLY